MHLYQYLLLIILSTIVFQACREQTAAPGKQPEPFFDLEAYMETQISKLNEKQPGVSKSILVDGQRETKQFDSLDYRTELKTFLKSDINRKAWVDKYSIDSTFEGSRLKSVVYKARAADVKTQLLRVLYEEGEVSDIYVENRTKSIVADVLQDLHFQPHTGYRLSTTQETVLSEGQKIEVEVTWE